MAAGLGFKTFTTGEVLTAADVNGYLMQGILVFASEAARNSAITSPQEGQFAFTKDNNSLWYYTGSAWVASGATGDIEGVTAGVGISGGGTSGTVTITNDMATTITASGDIVVGTGSGTYDNLPIGSTGQVLTADTTVSPYKVKWATPTTSSSGLTFISRTALSGASSYNWTDVFTATYKTYLIIIDRIAATTSTNTLRMRMRYGSTTDDGAGQYYQGGYVNTYLSANSNLSVSGGSYWELNDQCGDGQFARNTIWIDGVGTGSNTRAIYSNNGKTGGNQANVVSSGSCGETARNYTGFTLYTSGGTTLTGNVTIYGLAAA